MNLNQDIRGELTVLQPRGRIDSASSPNLEAVVLERLDAGCTRLVLDLSETEYISSAGLRVVLLAGKKLHASQGRLLLAGLRENVREVFEVSGFLSLFNVSPDVEQALAGR